MREPDSELDRRDGRGGRERRKKAKERAARKNKARDVIPYDTSDDTSNGTAEDETNYIKDNNKDDKVDGQQSANPIKGMKKGIKSKERQGAIGPSRRKVKEREEVKDQQVRQSETQQNTSLPPPGDKRPGLVHDGRRDIAPITKTDTLPAQTPQLSPSQPTTGSPVHGKETVQEPSPSIPNLAAQTTRLKPSQPKPELPGGNHSKRLVGGSGARATSDS